MNIENFFTLIIAPSISAVLAWVLARRKYIAEVGSNELDNVEKSIAIYRKMVEDLGTRVDVLSKGLKELQLENETLLQENKALRKRLVAMDREIKNLKAKNNENGHGTQ